MNHKILSWNTFTLVSNFHCVCFSSIKNCVYREKIRVKFNSIKKYLLLVKQKQKYSKIVKLIWMKPCLKTSSDKSAYANIFLELFNKLTLSLSWNECNIMLLTIYWLLYIDYLYILYYLLTLTVLTWPQEQNSEAAVGGTLKWFCKFHRKISALESLFYKIPSFQACNVTK